MEQIYFFTCGAVLILTLLTLWVAVIMPSPNHWNKRFFVTLFAVFVLCMIALFADLLVYNDPSMALAEKIAVYFEFLLLSIPMPMFTAYLLRTCGEDCRKSLLFRTVIILWGIYFFLLGVAQFTTFLYYVTPDNQYIRGSWYLLLVAPIFAVMFINLASVIQRRNKLSRKYFVAFLINLLPLQVALLVNTLVVETVVFVVLGLCISTLSMFAIILHDQIESYVGQQREIAHQRANIMVLQMRPHFIYNAMMSIYYLCARDPKKAQQVTLDFTTYLRKNFTAIASEDTVPFSDELEHTRAYLAVEQVQFEDSLCVEYDTPHKNFRLPPLTLQPIVENAVKHGMDPEYEPLHIIIRTRETDSGSEIIVEDNGPGFAPDDDSKPHIALANIRQRLEMMCGGKLTIRPREGGGTMVNVAIP
ncbi:MAG: histidine kinase [Selenomonadaceae bacterium]|nr:histidine kinase [Selenomonadaceae bacterium]MBR6887800.1 histidine kinase [Selenomonadaceae bacterium]